MSSACVAMRDAVERGLQLFVEDALVRGVHVDENQAERVLRQDVDAVQLGQRVAEWRRRFDVRRRMAGSGDFRGRIGAATGLRRRSAKAK
jgi:hypothetical protein